MVKKIFHVLYLCLTIMVICGCSDIEIKSDSNLTVSVPLDYLPALSGDYFKFNSDVVGRPFHIYVRLPSGYDRKSKKRYPVVYVLDGDSLFPILAANHLFLTYDDGLPEAIVVGISYGSFDPVTNKRGLDFSAQAADARKDQGGAPQFHDFLKSELLPEVESRYLTDPYKRILFGQSRGGYMVRRCGLSILLTKEVLPLLNEVDHVNH